jgi:hypothetical protein
LRIARRCVEKRFIRRPEFRQGVANFLGEYRSGFGLDPRSARPNAG